MYRFKWVLYVAIGVCCFLLWAFQVDPTFSSKYLVPGPRAKAKIKRQQAATWTYLDPTFSRVQAAPVACKQRVGLKGPKQKQKAGNGVGGKQHLL